MAVREVDRIECDNGRCYEYVGENRMVMHGQGPGPVLQQWTWALPMMHQSVLMTAVRNHDGVRKDDVSKVITRKLRWSFMRSARPRDEGRTFLGEKDIDFGEACRKFFADCDHYNMHWLMHLMHAAEILGYKHPDEKIRYMWWEFYSNCCKALHVRGETELQMDERLYDMLEEEE